MYQFILLIHTFIAICIVSLVLVQQGKGATMGAAFGSGASQTVFGSRGSGSFLFRITLSLAGVFFVTSLTLNYLTMHDYKQQQAMTPAIQMPLSAPAQNAAEKPATSQPATPAEIPNR